MKSRDFCYWLQGYFELRAKGESMTPEQVACVERHLSMVFLHEIDPSFPDGEKLDVAHSASIEPNKTPQLAPTGPTGPHPQIGGIGPGGTLYRC